MMTTFISRKIMEARQISLEAGKAKYRAYFIKVPTLYAAWKPEVDAILLQEDCGDCIVTV